MEAPQPASSRLSLKAIAQALFFFFSALGVLALTIKGKTEDKEKKKKKKANFGKGQRLNRSYETSDHDGPWSEVTRGWS